MKPVDSLNRSQIEQNNRFGEIISLVDLDARLRRILLFAPRFLEELPETTRQFALFANEESASWLHRGLYSVLFPCSRIFPD